MYNSPSQTTGIAEACATANGLTLSVQPPARMTYQQLLEHGCELLVKEGKSKQQVKNFASALRLWIRTHGYATDKVVAEEFSADFDRFLTRFCDEIAQRLAVSTQRDRQEQVIRWRRIAEALRTRDTLPTAFADALAQCLRTSPLSLRQVARDCGITVNSLNYWSSGRGQPRGQAVKLLPKLESVLELPRGTLVMRLPLARRTRYARGVEKNDTTTTFTNVRKSQLRRVGYYAMTMTSRLEQQWDDLMRMKTNPLRAGARGRNTWRLKPIDRVGSVISQVMVHDGQVCTTAAVHWGNIAPYLGWLTLSMPEGVKMAAEAADTLAWLADPELVVRYAEWRIGFSGRKFHNGINVFLQLVESYLRPNTGFVWLRPELRQTVPKLELLCDETQPGGSSERSKWQTHCELARRRIREFRERAEDAMGIRLSRDPKERIAVVLNDSFPLKKLVEFLEALERSAPPTLHRRDYRAWIRDVTMCRMLTSNPIRASQLAAMTFREDGTGNLVRVDAGRYRLRFEPSDFKNEKGAANKPYDVEVDASVAPWIDRYLAEARPNLEDADATDRFFLAAAVGPRKHKEFLDAHGMTDNLGWSAAGILSRLKTLTAIYIDNCSGFGPHAFRHIIATDHLRRHPGDYLTVAMLLHDKLETVLKNYGHLQTDDGLRALASGIQEATNQLAALRRDVAA